MNKELKEVIENVNEEEKENEYYEEEDDEEYEEEDKGYFFPDFRSFLR